MLKAYHERRLLESIHKRIIALDGARKGDLLSLYVEIKTRRIIATNSLIYDNPFAVPSSTKEEYDYLNTQSEKYRSKHKYQGSNSASAYAKHMDIVELAFDTVKSLSGIINSDKSIPELIQIYDLMFINYDERIMIIDKLKNLAKKLYINHSDAGTTKFTYNCIAYDPLYPTFIISLFEEDQLFKNRITDYQNILQHTDHNTQSVTVNALGCMADFMKVYHPDSNFEKVVDIQGIVNELVNLQNFHDSSMLSMTIFKSSRAYQIWGNVALLSEFILQYSHNNDPEPWWRHDFKEPHPYDPLWEVMVNSFDELKPYLPRNWFQ